MSLTWPASQTSGLRAWLRALLAPSAPPVRGATARPAVIPQGAVYPGTPLHPDLASTAHLAAHRRTAPARSQSLSNGADDPKKVLVIPGEALGHVHLDHINDMGLWPQGVATAINAIKLMRQDPQGWLAVIVDLDMIEQSGERTVLDALRRSRPDLPIIQLSRKPAHEEAEDSADMILTRPFSLQQLEVALDRPAGPEHRT